MVSKMSNLIIGRISENIKACRMSTGKTAEEFSNDIGINYKSYSRWENGSNIPLEKLILICKKLEINIDDCVNKRVIISIKFV